MSDNRRLTTVMTHWARGMSWPALLLGSTVLTVGAVQAQDACSLVGGIQTCSGDQSPGIVSGDTVETLIVSDLTGDITPTAEVAGILYHTLTGATLQSDTAAFAIVTDTADGIDIDARGGEVVVDHTGDITSGARGIAAVAHNGGVAVTGTGAVGAQTDGLVLDARGGAVIVKWTGDITAQTGQAVVAEAANHGVTLGGTGTLSGASGAVDLRARGAGAQAAMDWTGDIDGGTATAVTLVSDDGGASLSGAGTVTAGADGVILRATGANGAAVLSWDGAISTTNGLAAGLYASNGAASLSASGTVTAAHGFLVDARGGHADLTWDGVMETSDGAGLTVNTTVGGAVVSARGEVIARTDAIRIHTDGSGAAVAVLDNVTLTGVTGNGVAMSSATGAVTLRGEGTVTGATRGISAANTGNQTVAVDLQGDVTGGTEGIYLYSSDGDVALGGAGTVTGGQNAVHVETAGNGVASVDWDGTVTSLNLNGVHATSALGAVAVNTTGPITAAVGGIYAANSSGTQGNTVSVDHQGDITSGGVAIEARSPASHVSVRLDGDVESGSYGIYAEGRGNSTVSVTQAGSIDAGHSAIHAYSATGAVSVTQSGTLDAYTNGIDARNEGAGGVSVNSSGTIIARESGIDARSTAGHVSINAAGGITATRGNAINAVTAGDGTASVNVTTDLQAGANGLRIRSVNGNAVANVTGTITAGEAGVLMQAANGAASLQASGAIHAATRGVDISSTGNANTSVNITGDVTAGAEGIFAHAAQGSVSVGGTGTVTAGQHAIHLLAEGYNTASLDWRGALASAQANGVHATSANGAVSVNTTGDITSAAGAIYAANSSATRSNTVSVNHLGDITAGGVGIEARSPGSDVAVNVTGAVATGSYGVFAEGRGDATVSVTQDGSIVAGHSAIHAYSATGVVNVTQNGSLDGYTTGITARNEGGHTVSVQSTGPITARDQGIMVQSATGVVAVTARGDITARDGDAIHAANSGDATVSVDVEADLTAGGNGVMAQAAGNGSVYATVTGNIIAGEAGVALRNQGTGGVAITQAGDVTAGGTGLWAQSAVGNVAVVLQEGAVTAGDYGLRMGGYGQLSATVAAGATVTGDSAALLFDRGMEANLTNAGTLRAGDAAGYAILALVDDSAPGLELPPITPWIGETTNIHNTGTISGNILLNSRSAAFANAADAILETGTILDLGAGGRLDNAGTVAVGGSAAPMTTVMTGDLVTTATSRLGYDIDMAGTLADRLEIAGSATLAGEVALAFRSVSATGAEYDILTASGGTTTGDLWVADNAFLTNTLSLLDDGETLRLSVSGVDFAVAGLDGAGSSIADYFNRALAAGGTGLEDLTTGIVNAGTIAAAQEVFDALQPTTTFDSLDAVSYHAQGFTDALMSCRVPSGLSAPLREGSCTWTRMDYSDSTRGSAATGEAHSHALNLNYGVQEAWGDTDWYFGGAGGLTFARMENDAGGEASTDRVHLGFSAKYAPGPYQFSAAVSGSWGEVDMTREVSLDGETQVLTASTDLSTYAMKLRGAYLFGNDALYLMPQVDLDATYTVADRYRESGGSAALDVAGYEGTRLTLTPAIELGRTLRVADGGVTRIFGRIGTQFADDAGRILTSTVASDATGVSGFDITATGDSRIWTMSAGVTVFDLSGWSAEARVNWAVGDETDDRQASVKIRRAF